ncbi:hypothetical protein SIID45300_01946 [Candidatus Magnetaquicoccaceae bacterium FCR-1]|uniref:Uncharacterized protein n=1 Tax=Candidatus Magnetaquiglobus chichijimensis TaxID=3141448 RepID=A0ABQ0C9P7_9PROT
MLDAERRTRGAKNAGSKERAWERRARSLLPAHPMPFIFQTHTNKWYVYCFNAPIRLSRAID